ncbi:LamG domain-containing protein [Candidatus Nanosalina sp. VS9-1]|uniref:LamG domain-containing protein n=1 Tax=Candidatus Nanosalina sp. VS9-1 TaxID=3388566 RepID=UPI0039E0107B
MPKLSWNSNDFQNSQDSSGLTADQVSHEGNLQQGYQHGSLTRGLVAYYPMEKGEGQVLHDGAMVNLGQINGSNWTSGRIGQNALSFNGSDNYVQTSTKGPYDQESWTICIWLKTSATGNNAAIGNYDGTFPQVKIVVDEDGNGKAKLRVRDSGGSDVQPSSNTTVNDGQWHHIVGQRRNGKVNLFVDGVKENSVDDGTSEIDLTSADVRIGSRADNIEFFDGKLEEARFYNRALSKPEINALYNQGNGIQSGVQQKEKMVPGQSEGGVSRWKFNGDLTDSWGSNDGTNNGAMFDTGVYGQAAKFNGSNDEVIISNDNSLTGFDSFSVCCWMKPPRTDYQTTVAMRSGDVWQLEKGDPQAGYGPIFQVDDGSGSFPDVRHDSSLIQNKWIHVAGIRDTSEDKLKLYINGRMINQTTEGLGTPTLSPEGDLGIGARQNGTSYYYEGLIDDLRLYQQALTPVQVEKLYHKGAYRIPRKSTLQ